MEGEIRSMPTSSMTLDEPIRETIMRDVKSIGIKVSGVLSASGFEWLTSRAAQICAASKSVQRREAKRTAELGSVGSASVVYHTVCISFTQSK